MLFVFERAGDLGGDADGGGVDEPVFVDGGGVNEAGLALNDRVDGRLDGGVDGELFGELVGGAEGHHGEGGLRFCQEVRGGADGAVASTDDCESDALVY